MSAIFFFITQSAISAETVSETVQINTNKEHTDNSDGSALDIARLTIEKAINSYREGDMDASKRNLEIAIESLNTAANDSQTEKAREESRKLGIKIDKFKE